MTIIISAAFLSYNVKFGLLSLPTHKHILLEVQVFHWEHILYIFSDVEYIIGREIVAKAVEQNQSKQMSSHTATLFLSVHSSFDAAGVTWYYVPKSSKAL